MFIKTTENVGSYIAAISTDIFGVIGVTAMLLAISLARGKDEIIAFIFSLYPAALLTLHFPYHMLSFFSGSATEEPTRFVVFIATMGVTFLVIRNYVDSAYEQRALWRFIEGLALSFAFIGGVLAVLYHVVEIETFYDFSAILDTLFVSKTMLFFWLLAPLASIPLFIRP